MLDNTSNRNLLQEGLGTSVERHLRGYFAAHKGTLPASGLYDRVLREIEKPLLTLALTACKGNQLLAADLLGLNRNTLRKKIRDLDIKVTKRRRTTAQRKRLQDEAA